ncbi:MAG: magnesium transporter [Oscillospiraceae bacterium]
MYSTVLNYLKEKKYKSIHDLFMTMNEADIGELFQKFYDEEDIQKHELIILFRLLDKDVAADVFSYMDVDSQMMLINLFTDKELQDVIDDLNMDDTVDMIEEMPANVVSRILRNTDRNTRNQINQILKYPKDSAGAAMTTEYVYLKKDYTVKESIEKIRSIGMAKETVYTLYVTENRKLIGVLSILELITADEDKLIKDIMETNIISINTLDTEEDAANTLSKYDFIALPVVDKENRMVGIITFDDVMDIIQDNATEDFSKMSAVSPSEESYFKTPVIKHVKNRIVWLLVLMFSATITGMVINHYEAAFATVPILVSFIPMLSGTGGNSGSQTSAVVIRGMAIGEIKLKDFFKVLFKEFRIAIVCSIILAIANGIRILIMYKDWRLSVTVGGAIIATVIIAKLIACILPMAAKKLHLDPAVMAAPIITTIVDTCSIMVFFMIATVVFGL